MWCRAEQLCHYSRHGRSRMWLCSKRPEDAAASLNRLEDRWVIENLAIFDGECSCCRLLHNQMAMCDKEFLVKPVLGLVAELFLKRESNETAGEVYKTMMEVPMIRDKMFPKTFDFVSQRGTTRKALFGASIEWLVHFLVQNPKLEILAAIEGTARKVSMIHVVSTTFEWVDEANSLIPMNTRCSL